jgi:hypothetical protein
MKTLWLSSPRATFSVTINNEGRIIEAAPICWFWMNQHIDDLIKYFKIDKVEEI